MMKVRFGPVYGLSKIKTPYGVCHRANDGGIRVMGPWQRFVASLGRWIEEKAWDWSPLVSDDEAIRRGWAQELKVNE